MGAVQWRSWRLCCVLVAVLAGVCGVSGAQEWLQPRVVDLGSAPSAVSAVKLTGGGPVGLLAVRAAGEGQGSTTVLAGDGAGGFAGAGSVATAGTDVTAVRRADGVGTDLLWAAAEGGSIALRRARGDVAAKFVAPETLASFAVEGSLAPVLRLAAGAGGGLAIADVANARLYVVAPRQDGTWAAVGAARPLLTGVTRIWSADVHGDGRADVVAQAAAGVQVFRWLGQGLAAPELCVCGGTVESALTADADGDGKLDMVVAGADGKIDIYHGNGDGTFATSSEAGAGVADAGTGHGGRLVGVADLNGDGIADLVTSNALGVSVLLGQGNGNYGLKGVYDAGPDRTSFALADFNGDGHTDLAVNHPKGVEVLFGRPDGSFAALLAVGGTVTASPEPSMYGNVFTLTATLAPSGTTAATGTVTFQVDGLVVGTAAVVNNAASYTVSGLGYTKGTHTIVAAYSGDLNYAATTLNGTHVVTGLRSQTDFTISTPIIYYGQFVGGQGDVVPIDTAPGASVVGGTITFYDGTRVICMLTIATVQTSCPASAGGGFTVGTHQMMATYSGNQYYDSSSSPMSTVLVLPDPTSGTLTSSLNPAVVGQAVTLTATFTSPYAGAPTGTVTFFDGAAVIGTAALNASGAATLTTSSLAVGTHSLTAQLATTQNFTGSVTAAVAQVILPVVSATTTTLSSSVNPSNFGQNVTFTATVTATLAGAAVPAGTVTFTIDGATAGTAALGANGTAAFSTATLAPGTHTVVATYGGSVAAAGSVSATLSQVVVVASGYAGGGYTLTITPATLSVPIGSYGTATVTVTPIAGFSQTVALSCADMPYAGTCSFANPNLTAGSYTTTLTVFATAPHDCGSNTPYFVASGPGAGLGALGVALLTLPLWRRRRALLKALALAAVMAVLPLLGGCGHCTDLGVKPGTYRFTVTATAPVATTKQTVRFTAHL